MSARVAKRAGGRGGGMHAAPHRILVHPGSPDEHPEIDERKTKLACSNFFEVNREVLKEQGVTSAEVLAVAIEKDSKGGVFTFRVPVKQLPKDVKQSLAIAFKSKYYRHRNVKVTIYDNSDAIIRQLQDMVGTQNVRTALSEIKGSENVQHNGAVKKTQVQVLQMLSPEKTSVVAAEQTPQRGTPRQQGGYTPHAALGLVASPPHRMTPPHSAHPMSPSYSGAASPALPAGQSLPQSMYHPQLPLAMDAASASSISVASPSTMGVMSPQALQPRQGSVGRAQLPPPYPAGRNTTGSAAQMPTTASASDLPDLVAMDADGDDTAALPPLVPQEDAAPADPPAPPAAPVQPPAPAAPLPPSEYELTSMTLSSDSTFPQSVASPSAAVASPYAAAAAAVMGGCTPLPAAFQHTHTTPSPLAPPAQSYLSTPSPTLAAAPCSTPTLTSLAELSVHDTAGAAATFNTAHVGGAQKLLFHAATQSGINVVKKVETRVVYGGQVEVVVTTGIDAFTTLALPLPASVDTLRRLKELIVECAGCVDGIDLPSVTTNSANAVQSLYSNNPYAEAAMAAAGRSPLGMTTPHAAATTPQQMVQAQQGVLQQGMPPIPPPTMASSLLAAATKSLNINALPFVPGPTGTPQAPMQQAPPLLQQQPQQVVQQW